LTLRTLMQAGPAKANELFTRLAETSDGALKTRERLFAELKAELELHADLEEQHLFPVLRKHVEMKELVVGAAKDNKELRGKLAELDAQAKNDETFLAKISELKKAFRQHARDETKELLSAVQKALSEEQVQGIAEKMETGLADAEQARHDQVADRRATARQEREQAELRSQQDETADRERQERAEAQARQEEEMEQERQAVARRTREAALQTVQAVVRTAEVAGESTRQVARSTAEGAQRVATASAAAPTTGFLFWDVMLGMSGLQPSRSVSSRNAGASHADRTDTRASGGEQVIPLAEEVLTVGTQKVSTGVTSVRRYVVETPVERHVTLVRERVVVERRRPVTDKVSGEMLTELTVEVTETDEIPVVGKAMRLKEEIVVRTERTEHVETVRDTVRRDEVEIEHADARRPARLRAAVRG